MINYIFLIIQMNLPLDIINVIIKELCVEDVVHITSSCISYHKLLTDDIWKYLIVRDYNADYKSYISQIQNDNKNNITALENISIVRNIFNDLKTYETNYEDKYAELYDLDLLFDEEEASIKYRLNDIKYTFDDARQLETKLKTHYNKYILESPLEDEFYINPLKIYKQFYTKNKYISCKFPMYYGFCGKKSLTKLCPEHRAIANTVKDYL